MSVNSRTYHTHHTPHIGREAASARPARGVNAMRVNTAAIENRPNVEQSAKLPYRRPTVAIPLLTLVAAMGRGLEAAEGTPGHVPGVPIIRQPVEVEETYWRECWRRLGRPDPGLATQGES